MRVVEAVRQDRSTTAGHQPQTEQRNRTRQKWCGFLKNMPQATATETAKTAVNSLKSNSDPELAGNSCKKSTYPLAFRLTP